MFDIEEYLNRIEGKTGNWRKSHVKNYDYGYEIGIESARFKRRYSESREFNYENDSWGSATIATVRTESIYEAYAEYRENGNW